MFVIRIDQNMLFLKEKRIIMPWTTPFWKIKRIGNFENPLARHKVIYDNDK